MTTIDLRSDTITKPSDAMRDAIAHAVVGDDVYHDDPTVNALERHVAALLGKEDAMFVPTGTMSNQVAVRCHTEPGDVVIIETDGHIGSHEMGGAAHHSGVTLKRLTGLRGTFTPEELEDAIPVPHPSLPSHLYEPHTLVCLENTHNEAGGTIWELDQMRAVTAVAADHGMATHLDGARLWNASAATGIDVADYAATFDTVSVCFSKGLGAPVGSALVGSSVFISRARRFKQMFGGGFRQAGMLAAGAHFALDNHRDRLVVDHANAHRFAEAIAKTDGADVDLDSVHTNIVYFEVDDPGRVVDLSLDRGVAMLVTGTRRVRAVFHLDVSPEQTDEAADIVRSVIDG
jgi:threonine aldolase